MDYGLFKGLVVEVDDSKYVIIALKYKNRHMAVSVTWIYHMKE